MRNATKFMLVFAAIGAWGHGQAANLAYKEYTAKMTCGKISYAVTSICKKSGDALTLNECKRQTLKVANGGVKRVASLPDLTKLERARIRESGGDLKDLYVIAWACTESSIGPVATFYYSIGGGTAEYSEALAHYDMSGMLMDAGPRLTPNDISEAMRNLKPVPSIMPDQ
ncbi:hypothetical protein B0920_05025 [Massilia sp. KIM]|uniref:hypothetical protein n=1 Tax=Massilia sp. KIM TaxID=1955422 RepID=UPI00098E9D79|nr:hypothetical protein [Massilia sp. KIM]OON62798.1 hypothetical protein B0920_05025 [Massilia sp. KIM]